MLEQAILIEMSPKRKLVTCLSVTIRKQAGSAITLEPFRALGACGAYHPFNKAWRRQWMFNYVAREVSSRQKAAGSEAKGED